MNKEEIEEFINSLENSKTDIEKRLPRKEYHSYCDDVQTVITYWKEILKTLK